ncbi:protein kinase [Streptomyces aurantiacus]|uniref:serine/threonine-protein kinase n=1 Tax=Streptomyces aurantiacus TaxID=47760 RepID=UPI003330F3BD
MLTPLPRGGARRIGPYRLLARIGAGGMGEVFLARREETAGASSLVALKAVRRELDLDDAFRARFRREIAAARAVAGPYTAALVDGDADAELPWLATEYVPGPSLADAVARGGPLPVPAVRALGAGLARALTAVHAARVLHRDLKPGNVLLTPDGPRLIDFGIAQVFEATALTMTGALVGTPGFLSPEQIEGSGAVVPASDVFSLGAVLCHAATGHGPFDDPEPASVVFRIVRGDADLSRVPAELRGVISACLHPDPARRPTATALAEALSGPGEALFPWPAGVLSLFAEYRGAAAGFERADLHGEFASAETMTGDAGPRLPTPPSPPPHAAPVPPVPPAAAPRRRRRWPWVLTAGAVTAGLVVAAVTLPDALRDDPESTPSKPPSAAGTPADRLVTTYGNADHSGELGPSAVRKDALPEGWRPWSRKLPQDRGTKGTGCVLAGATLVCRDGRGGARALDAATGDERWSAPGFPRRPTGVQELPPETDGKRVYVPSELGVSGLDLRKGRKIWRHATPRHAGLISMTYAHGVVYTAEFNSDGAPDPGTTTLRARRAASGEQLWQRTVGGKPQGTPLVRGGLLYAALEKGGAVALSTEDGDRAATVSKPRCDGLIGHKGAVLCWSRTRGGIQELDRGTLAVGRTIGAGKKPVVAPVVGTADVLVVASVDPDFRRRGRLPDRLTAYAWRTGRELWDQPARGEPSQLALAGNRVLAVGEYDINSMPLTGGTSGTTQRTIPYTDVKVGGSPKSLSLPLFLGGAVFAGSSEGRLVSGRAL